MKKTLQLIVLFAATLLSACSSEDFDINVDLDNLGTQNLRVIYAADDALHSMWMPVVDGKFTFKGKSAGYTVVEIYNSRLQFVTCMAVRNGETVDVSGDFKKPYRIAVGGNGINEELTDFLKDNADSFEKSDFAATDSAVEKFVKESGEPLASDILIKYYYSNQSPEALARLNELRKTQTELFSAGEMGQMLQNDEKPADAIPSFILYSNADSMESFIASDSRNSVIYFWNTDSAERKKAVKAMKSLRKEYPSKKQLQIADISFINDTSSWRETLRLDSAKWKHFWGLGGRMNSEVKRMGVTSAPAFIVTDSVGRILYRGASCDSAGIVLRNNLKKDTKTEK